MHLFAPLHGCAPPGHTTPHDGLGELQTSWDSIFISEAWKVSHARWNSAPGRPGRRVALAKQGSPVPGRQQDRKREAQTGSQRCNQKRKKHQFGSGLLLRFDLPGL
jgi:hypothetical protein